MMISCRVTYILILTCVVLLFPSCKKDVQGPEDQLPQKILAAVNTLRNKGCRCGLDSMPPVSPLSWNLQLEAAAKAHALDMYFQHYFDHIAPNGSSPIQRAQEAGYPGMYVGENIAKGYTSLDEAMKAWQQSEEHCKAMMDTLYIQLGAYYYHGYWVQEFGK